MSGQTAVIEQIDTGGCAGLRMDAEAFFQLPDDGRRYELVDGVVVMSPSPTPRHQMVMMEVAGQLWAYLREHPCGTAVPEVDVGLGEGPRGGDLVYRPELVFFRRERLPEVPERLVGAPDLVVEIISPDSRRMDTETKKDDYERCGVGEYWLIDPSRRSMTFYRLKDGRFVEVPVKGDRFASEVVEGFSLDLTRVRETFKP